MKRVRMLLSAAAIAAAAGATGCGPKDPSSLHIVNLRVELPADGRSPVLRFAVDNGLPARDSLVSIASPDAGNVTVSASTDRRPDSPVDLPARTMTRFDGRGTRVQLDGLRRQLEQGDQVQANFVFGSGTVITLIAPVVAAGSPGPDEGHD